ncbi:MULTISPECIES: DUF3761 domain-containing protein [Mycobacterium]|uniref:DUF3761 domain-containing protein n=1 Tax=Mycobacterium kiyosense TaxID=2871094 RepID=A0A9P3Q581_9MYCO|nr:MULTISPECIES: DUF3761 domain-containing protein [Mycobacterium]BDB44835.1 hypothetical protein IWGMT90018_52810 [Mycobacterium kiyosense]BDE16323.1 hypothetical protein MKCMC460_51830 [Mycobacterium sp. 20KCMC460]GLB82799.1 hypothetical protein SRL2020028_20550 [Mycobacterium kiyosense]GLB94960.1 hypothetical protein SRL2020226_17360 [Mycobacterium kiyosense]GLC00378.1 hypothetical protein SRL2020400_09690 [Mycobacterium kiyosense]
MFLRIVVVAAFIGTAALAPPPQASAQSCSKGYYKAASGNCVHRPICGVSTQPDGATALCNDGCWSFSENPSEDDTCSGHGGAKKVL